MPDPELNVKEGVLALATDTAPVVASTLKVLSVFPFGAVAKEYVMTSAMPGSPRSGSER